MSFKVFLKTLLDVDIHFTKGHYTNNNILVSKSDYVHAILLITVVIYGVLYGIVSFTLAYHYQAALCACCGFFALIALLIHRMGYTLASKLINFTQLITIIALMFYFPSSPYGEHVNDSVLAFYVPVIIGTLIAFQGKQKHYGQILAVFVLLLISILILSDIHYPEHPKSKELIGPNIDMLLNITGAAIATFAEVAFILALNDRLNNSLIKTNQELDNFVYIVSHDLRSPLLSTKGLIDLAKMKIDEREQVQKYLGLAVKSINNLDDIIHEILAYSRNARTDLQEETFDIKELIQEVIDGLRFSAGNGFSFREKYIGTTLVHCDKSRLNTVLRNIIGNSVKYQKKDIEFPFVHFSFENLKGNFTINITDNGEGIPAESLERVFDMFYRGTTTGNGTGLGLYICKEMLEKMNARYTISSLPGEGTDFSIQISRNSSMINGDHTLTYESTQTEPPLHLNESPDIFPGLSSTNQAG